MSNVNMGSRNAPKEGRKPSKPRTSPHNENRKTTETYKEDLPRNQKKEK